MKSYFGTSNVLLSKYTKFILFFDTFHPIDDGANDVPSSIMDLILESPSDVLLTAYTYFDNLGQLLVSRSENDINVEIRMRS